MNADPIKPDRRAKYAERRATSLCVRCGVAAAPGRSLCAPHAAESTEYQRARDAKRRVAPPPRTRTPWAQARVTAIPTIDGAVASFLLEHQ